jgi:DNA-binding CsgD family transcriptional regulator
MSENTDIDRPALTAEERLAAVQQLGLTLKDAQVATLIAQDMPAKGIARTLGIQESTVRSHIRLIHAKLQVTTNIGVAVLVVQKLRDTREHKS